MTSTHRQLCPLPVWPRLAPITSWARGGFFVPFPWELDRWSDWPSLWWCWWRDEIASSPRSSLEVERNRCHWHHHWTCVQLIQTTSALKTSTNLVNQAMQVAHCSIVPLSCLPCFPSVLSSLLPLCPICPVALCPICPVSPLSYLPSCPPRNIRPAAPPSPPSLTRRGRVSRLRALFKQRKEVLRVLRDLHLRTVNPHQPLLVLLDVHLPASDEQRSRRSKRHGPRAYSGPALWQFGHLGAVLLAVGRSYVGNDVTHSTLLDRAGACSYENLPKYRSYRVSNTAPWAYCRSDNLIRVAVRSRRVGHPVTRVS